MQQQIPFGNDNQKTMDDTLRGRTLFCFVLFEKLPCFFEGEGVSVDLEFVSAGVFRDRDDMADSVAVLAEGLDDEIDVYHG
jgi:hypothetical protein